MKLKTTALDCTAKQLSFNYITKLSTLSHYPKTTKQLRTTFFIQLTPEAVLGSLRKGTLFDLLCRPATCTIRIMWYGFRLKGTGNQEKDLEICFKFHIIA